MIEDDLRRLRWRCRRGMLELDIVLSEFLDDHASSLTEQQVGFLLRFLEFPDPYIFNALFSGCFSSGDPEVDSIIAMIK
ncbi:MULTISPECIES: succinate dehydrogenase assembly factor 2 [Candidatus Ichthyocystis]|uniref:FAD assembly factor SdhE n=1 Tax=Candidatus Ichthyocystis hellenicum TaxID=1561003 RepID=A0A0S4M378_9BURK|nr:MULTISPECIES: succinate dehydrogenase assembly factor 2 [Ichthyocystis]CUT18081.1 putative flavinator of succinate dehydrogenase [Candidatus Ichthyocystis hellenicum]